MPTTTIDRATLRRLSALILETLAPLAAKEGLVIKAEGGSFGGSYGAVKFSLSCVAPDGKVASKEAVALEAFAPLYGLPAGTKVGTKFKLRGDTYTITGLRPRASRMPVLATRDDNGRGYKFEAKSVAAALVGVAK